MLLTHIYAFLAGVDLILYLLDGSAVFLFAGIVLVGAVALDIWAASHG